MTVETLGYISQVLKDEQIPYCFRVWSKPLSYPYFVGEYHESEPVNESGESESVFILNGFGNGDFLSLEQLRDRIRYIFPTTGKTHLFPNGMGAAIMFASSQTVPCESETLKRIQINLKIKEWSVK